MQNEKIKKIRRMLGITDDASVVDLTPELAAELLKLNTNNRTLSSKTVSNLQKQMIHGEFRLSNDAITFDDNGVLTNGQHRLTALALLKGKIDSIPFMIGFGVKQFMGMDTGRRRSMQDNYMLFEDGKLSDPKYAICLRVAKDACLWCNGGYTHKYISQEEYKTIINFLEDDLITCYDNGLFAKGTQFITMSVMTAMFLAYLNGVDVSVLSHIHNILTSGIIESENDRCIIKLRDKLIMTKGNGRQQVSARITYTMDCIQKVHKNSRAELIKQGTFYYTYKQMPYAGSEWKA